jgi:FkbH-like protein
MWTLKANLFRRPKPQSSVPAAQGSAPSQAPPPAPPPVLAKVAAPLPAKQHFLAPTDLEVTDIGPKSALFIGACFLFEWSDSLQTLGYTDLSIDRLLFYNLVRLPDSPPKPVDSYDVQLVQIPLPSIMPEQEYFRLSHSDPQPFEALLEACVGRLDLFLSEALVWSDRIPTFVMTYLTPQQNLEGRLFPRYDLRNPIHFIERLNEQMERLLRPYQGVYLLDTNHIAGVYGRRFIQEDAFWYQHHGSLMSWADTLWDGEERLEKSPPARQIHGAQVDDFVGVVWREVRAIYRTLKRADEVKMLCVDLDDTLWRGLIGESDGKDGPLRIRGWPMGLAEVLLYLKRRGIILAIISKNDEMHVRSLWGAMFDRGLLRLEDFAIVKINRRPKPENIAEAIAEANVLPGSVVFLDDNPVERAAVKAAFPEIRVIETSHLRWARVLGWSPELQVAKVSAESARRTEMIQAQVERQKASVSLSREQFLGSLNLRIAVCPVKAIEDSRYVRAFELINKTNQFNTTGVRWLGRDAAQYFEEGGTWWTFEASDRYTNYGLIGVVCIKGTEINQFVMSCRVAGLEAELGAFSVILDQVRGNGEQFVGFVQETKNNAVSRDIFQRLGWALIDGRWTGPPVTPMPSHLTAQVAMASSSQ